MSRFSCQFLIRSAQAGRIFRRAGLVALVTATLSACLPTPPSTDRATISAAPPAPRPGPSAAQEQLRRDRAARARAANLAAQAALQTPASQNISEYLVSIERGLLARGKLRADDGSALGLITPEQLTENFVQTALHDEYTRQGDTLVAASHPSPLRRWEAPVRMQVDYGDSVSPAKRSRVGTDIREFAARLHRVTGHPVTTASSGNFNVLILSEDERRQMGPMLHALVPGIPASDVSALVNLAPQNMCTVFAYTRGNNSDYIRAVALIRAELPPRLMLSCIHEELAQGMGPANDSPHARPSVFNDDEEFALLTWHDELLLKILYDRRLRPGMNEAEARPIVLQIARELLAQAGQV